MKSVKFSPEELQKFQYKYALTRASYMNLDSDYLVDSEDHKVAVIQDETEEYISIIMLFYSEDYGLFEKDTVTVAEDDGCYTYDREHIKPEIPADALKSVVDPEVIQYWIMKDNCLYHFHAVLTEMWSKEKDFFTGQTVRYWDDRKSIWIRIPEGLEVVKTTTVPTQEEEDYHIDNGLPM